MYLFIDYINLKSYCNILIVSNDVKLNNFRSSEVV